MNGKRVNYMQLLKESVGGDKGHDTTDTIDVNGPFLDPILGYDGGGELPTHKDAASILERYYFKGDADPGVHVEGESPEQDPAAKHHEAAGRGGKDGKSDTVAKGKAEVAKDVKQEDTELDAGGDVLEEDEILEDDVENAVIERLIAEMEEDGGELVEGEAPEQDPVGKTKVHAPSGLPNKDSSGLIDGDKHEKEPPAAKLKEEFEADLADFDDLLEMEDEVVPGGEVKPEKEGTDNKDEDDKLDVDKKIDEKEVKESGNPIGNPKTPDEELLDEWEELEESFEIFKEAIAEDDDDDDDDDKKPVKLDADDIQV